MIGFTMWPCECSELAERHEDDIAVGSKDSKVVFDATTIGPAISFQACNQMDISATQLPDGDVINCYHVIVVWSNSTLKIGFPMQIFLKWDPMRVAEIEVWSPKERP